MDNIPASYMEEFLESNLNEDSMAKELFSYSALKFASVGVFSPIETCKTLMQVQYESKLNASRKFKSALQEGGSRNSQEGLFKSQEGLFKSQEGLFKSQETLTRRKEEKIGTELPLIKHQGVYQAMKSISNYQGVFSLWQGQLTSWIYSMLQDGYDLITNDLLYILLQEEKMNNWQYEVTSFVGLQLFSGIVFSPIELIKTRLIIQSNMTHEKKYFGPFHALKTILKEEGFCRLYRNIWLTVSYHLIIPACKYIPNLLLSRYLERPDASIAGTSLYLLIRFGIMSMQLLITMPIETIRKRLMIQHPFIKRVNVSSVPYSSAWNCLSRIIREEGVSSLYQGLQFNLASNVASNLVLLFNIWMDSEEAESLEV